MAKSNVILNPATLNEHNSVIYFSADWHEPCKDMAKVYQQLSVKFPNLTYYQLNAEDYPDLAEKYEIETVPTFVFGSIDRVQGANAPALAAMIEKHSKLTKLEFAKPKKTIDFARLVNSYPIMIFINGTPLEPKCPSSAKLVNCLADLNVQYGAFDVLADESVKQLSALAEFPQGEFSNSVYISGNLVGTYDTVKDLIEKGQFVQMIPEELSLDARLEKLINQSPVMIFVKGDRHVPKCGFSRQLMQLLGEHNIEYESFDILQDEEVRQGLKTFSDWPTFPQVYVKGELQGGLDIVKEMLTSGEFASLIKQN